METLVKNNDTVVSTNTNIERKNFSVDYYIMYLEKATLRSLRHFKNDMFQKIWSIYTYKVGNSQYSNDFRAKLSKLFVRMAKNNRTIEAGIIATELGANKEFFQVADSQNPYIKRKMYLSHINAFACQNDPNGDGLWLHDWVKTSQVDEKYLKSLGYGAIKIPKKIKSIIDGDDLNRLQRIAQNANTVELAKSIVDYVLFNNIYDSRRIIEVLDMVEYVENNHQLFYLLIFLPKNVDKIQNPYFRNLAEGFKNDEPVFDYTQIEPNNQSLIRLHLVDQKLRQKFH